MSPGPKILTRKFDDKKKEEPVLRGVEPTTATLFAIHGWDVVVFGSAPNPHSTWSYERGSAGRMARISGRKMTWFNLFGEEPERWSPEDAKASAEQWCETYSRRLLNHKTTLLLLGTKVCAAFGIDDPEWLQTYASQMWTPMIAFPHPSGLNRWWNDPDNERDAWRVAHLVASGKYFTRLNYGSMEEKP